MAHLFSNDDKAWLILKKIMPEFARVKLFKQIVAVVRLRERRDEAWTRYSHNFWGGAANQALLAELRALGEQASAAYEEGVVTQFRVHLEAERILGFSITFSESRALAAFGDQ